MSLLLIFPIILKFALSKKVDREKISENGQMILSIVSLFAVCAILSLLGSSGSYSWIMAFASGAIILKKPLDLEKTLLMTCSILVLKSFELLGVSYIEAFFVINIFWHTYYYLKQKRISLEPLVSYGLLLVFYLNNDVLIREVFWILCLFIMFYSHFADESNDKGLYHVLSLPLLLALGENQMFVDLEIAKWPLILLVLLRRNKVGLIPSLSLVYLLENPLLIKSIQFGYLIPLLFLMLMGFEVLIQTIKKIQIKDSKLILSSGEITLILSLTIILSGLMGTPGSIFISLISPSLFSVFALTAFLIIGTFEAFQHKENEYIFSHWWEPLFVGLAIPIIGIVQYSTNESSYNSYFLIPCLVILMLASLIKWRPSYTKWVERFLNVTRKNLPHLMSIRGPELKDKHIEVNKAWPLVMRPLSSQFVVALSMFLLTAYLLWRLV